MSCIAVNIHEVKRETVKFELVAPLSGKDGKEQKGKFRDVFTGQEITSYTLPKAGFYECKSFYIGTNVNDIGFAGAWSAVLLKHNVFVNTSKCYYSEYLEYATADNLVRPLRALINFQPSTVLQYYCACYRYVPD